jgi:DNA-binding transcriptional LysR family regulator
MNLTDLDTFLHVVDSGSFTGAAAALGLPKSTVSRRVARLEDTLGLELLTRQARSFTVSPYGRQLHARCAPALLEIADAERALAETTGEPAGTLRITALPDLGATSLFAQLLAEYRDNYPKVRLDVDLTTRRVDIVGEGYDIALRAHSRPLADTSSLVARRLMGGVSRLFASPSYLDEQGRPRSPKDLVRHHCLALHVPVFDQGWPLTRTNEAEAVVYPIDDVVRSNDFLMIIGLALQGCGVALLPAFLVDPHVETGELEPVLPRWKTTTGQFSLVWPVSRYPAPRVRAFIDHTTEFFSASKAIWEGAD